MRHAGYEAKLAYKSGNFICLASIIAMSLDLSKSRVLFANDIEHFLVCEHLALTPFVAVERHVFDEADFDVLLPPHLNERYDFSLVDPAHDYAVDLELDSRSELIHL